MADTAKKGEQLQSSRKAIDTVSDKFRNDRYDRGN